MAPLVVTFWALAISSAHAQSEPRWRASASAFTANGIPRTVRNDLGVSVGLERIVRRDDRGREIGLSARYTTYTLGGGQRIKLTTPLIEWRGYTDFERTGRFEGPYVSLGAGLLFGSNLADERVRRPALSLGMGIARRTSFIELRLLSGKRTGENGVMLGIGLRR